MSIHWWVGGLISHVVLRTAGMLHIDCWKKNWIVIEKMLKWMYNEAIKDLKSWASTDSFLVPKNSGNWISHQVKDDMHKFVSRKFH